MGIIDALFERRQRVGESFHVSQTPPGSILELFGAETASGVVVNESNALTYGPLFTCVRVLSETEASLPLFVYRRRENGGRDRASDHGLYALLHDAPNPEMTSLQWREAMMNHLCTWGNHYSEIEWSNGGRVLGLWPLRPDKMRVAREGGQLVYRYRLPDKFGAEERRLPRWRVLHVPAFGFDGLMGYSPIQLHQEAIALGMATTEYGARFYANDASPGGVLEHPGNLSDTAQERLVKTWEGRHGGLSKKHRLAILEEGMKWHEVGLPPETAQFLQTRTFQKREMAMIYRVPLHMIQDLERATFSNIEHLGLEFLTYTMLAWLVRIEQALALQLLSPAERTAYFIEHLVDAIERGDIQSRYSAYAVGRQWGWLSANDVRQRENMNPVEGGDVYLVPLNMIPASQAGLEPSLEQTPPARANRALLPGEESRARGAARERHRLMLSHRRLYRETAARILRREANDVGALARKRLGGSGVADFLFALDDFYRDHQGFIAEQVKPLAFSYGELVAASAQAETGQGRGAVVPGEEGRQDDEPGALSPEMERWIGRYVEDFAARHVTISVNRIREAVQKALNEGRDVTEALDELLGAWREETGRASQIADGESSRFSNGLARAVYVLAGVQYIRWVAFGESCPYCSALDGQVVGINRFFLEAGDFQPEGADRPLTVSSNVGHAPAHAGCDCMTVAT